jgi:hypothetical protein
MQVELDELVQCILLVMTLLRGKLLLLLLLAGRAAVAQPLA